MKKVKFIFIIMVLPLILMISCNKETEDEAPEYISPTERSVIVNIPSGLQTKAEDGDMNALMATVYMGLANTLSGFSGSFKLPSNAQIQNKKSNSYIYNWSMNNFSYWITYSILPDKYTWTYDYEFPDNPRFTFIYAEENKTAKAGAWMIYDREEPGLKVWNYQWNINSLNSFIASIKFNVTGNSNEGIFEIVANTDNSGSFLYKIGLLNKAEILWNANGSGTYKIWDGEVLRTGFWN